MPRYLALDADAGGLFVAAGGTAGRGGFAAEQVLAAADDLGPLSPANAAARGARLKELLAAAAVKPAPLLLVVGRDRVILKDVTHPPTAPADEPAVVRFQAARDLTDAADDVVMDYLPLPPAADGQRRATAVFVRKDVLIAARQLADAAGLKLLGVTPRPFTAPAVVAPLAGVTGPAALVAAWPGGGEFTVVTGGRVRFTRPLTAPPEATAGEVRRNATVYAGQHPDAPLEVVLVAEAAGTPGGSLADRLAEVLAVPVQSIDPAAQAPGAAALAGSLHGRLAAPLALLGLKAAADALPVNFVQPRAPRAEPSKNRGRLVLAALAAVLVIGAVGLFAYLETDTAAARVAALVEQKKGLQAQLDRLQPDVNRLKAADEFAAREVVVLDELFELAARVPDVSKVSVVQVDLTAKPPAAKKGGPGGGAGAASSPPAGKAPPAPIASLKVLVRSSDDALVQRMIDDLARDKAFYLQAKKDTGGAGEAGGRGPQQYVLTADLVRRPPAAYTRRIAAELPPPAAPAPAPDFGFGGGFAP